MSVAEQSPEENVLVDVLVKSYKTLKTLGGLTPCSWVAHNYDYSLISKHMTKACHAEMNYETKGMDVILTSFPNTDDDSVRYFKYLLRGPFRAYQDKISLETSPDGHLYVKIVELGSWPSNVLFNFCVATRVPFEHRPKLDQWVEMTKKGIDEGVAFLVSAFRYNGWDQPISKEIGYINNHFWFDGTVSWERHLNGSFDQKRVHSQSYKEHPAGCTPSNVIWGVSDFAERTLLTSGLTPAELCDHYGVPFEPPKPKRVRNPTVAKIEELAAPPIPIVNPLLNPGDHVVINNQNFIVQAQDELDF